MGWDLGLEGRVHIQLVRVYHRVFWWAQRKIEEHKDGIGRDLKRCMCFFGLGRWRRGSVDISPLLHGSIRLFPNI